jgi:hypothetical protein
MIEPWGENERIAQIKEHERFPGISGVGGGRARPL